MSRPLANLARLRLAARGSRLKEKVEEASHLQTLIVGYADFIVDMRLLRLMEFPLVSPSDLERSAAAS